ncbi:MAG: MBL fold metallo-hydrolase [Bacillota bacterium]|nr:MBL fold metallo-hydrolase [Bacillota bacterium]
MIISLSEQIKVIRPEAKSVFPYSNSLFVDDEVPTMIDAGSGGRAYSAVSLDRVNKLLLSHYHFDHINGYPFFKQAEVYAGIEEKWAYEDERKFILSSGYQHWETLMGEEKNEEWSKRFNLPDDVPVKPGFQPINLKGFFQDGDRFITGKTAFVAIHAPGHTSGHYGFFFPNERILFSGDMDIAPRGPWYGSEYSDFEALVGSVNRLKALKPDILVTSHRKVFYNEIDSLFDDYLGIALEKETKILQYLTVPRSIDDMAGLKFSSDSEVKNSHEMFWKKMMIMKHLTRLGNKHLVRRLSDNRYVRDREGNNE